MLAGFSAWPTPHMHEWNGCGRSRRQVFRHIPAIPLTLKGDEASPVLQEFYVQATRSTRRHPLTHETAIGLVSAWTRFTVQEITLLILTGALEIEAAYGFSHWDSAIIAAARALGCRELYSEDMSHRREVEGIIIINPFR